MMPYTKLYVRNPASELSSCNQGALPSTTTAKSPLASGISGPGHREGSSSGQEPLGRWMDKHRRYVGVFKRDISEEGSTG